jgi:hypothetical protein
MIDGSGFSTIYGLIVLTATLSDNTISGPVEVYLSINDPGNLQRLENGTMTNGVFTTTIQPLPSLGGLYQIKIYWQGNDQYNGVFSNVVSETVVAPPTPTASTSSAPVITWPLNLWCLQWDQNTPYFTNAKDIAESGSTFGMNVPAGESLMNKIITERTFDASSLDVKVHFKIVNPQNEPNYAIFLYAKNSGFIQELDWESDSAGGQHATYYYNQPDSNNPKYTLVPLLYPWNKTSQYYDFNTLEFKLEPTQVTVLINGNVVSCNPFSPSSFKVNPAGEFNPSLGGFDAPNIQLLFETTQGQPSGIHTKTATTNSALIVDSVTTSCVGSLSWTVGSPANIMVTAPDGSRVGYDATSGATVNEIQDAVYSGPGTEPQNITIPNPSSGNYSYNLFGTGSGNYTVTVQSVAYGGSSIDTKVVTGTISPGASISKSFALDQNGTMSTPKNSTVPEFPWGAIAAMPVMLTTSFCLFVFSKRRTKKTIG